jgi:ParB/RepB/Spo0J family partition protein
MENIQFAVLSLGDIVLSGSNPRIVNQKTQSFADLVESIKAGGIRVPIMVRPHPKQKGKYELLAGNRRIVAAQAAKVDKVPCNIHPDISDEAAFDITFFENFGREDLTPLEEGKAAVISLEKYKGDVKAAASKLGKSEKWILQRIAIEKNLCAEIKKEITQGENNYINMWTASHLQLIAGLPAEMQRLIWHNYCDDMPTTKKLEAEILQMLRPVNKAPWQLDEKAEVSICGKKIKVCCSTCIKRSSSQPGLFDDISDPEKIKKDDKCLSKECWDQRMKAYVDNKAMELKKEHPELALIVKGHRRWDDEGYELNRTYNHLLFKGDYKICKKDNKNAIPALVVNGQGVGQVEYIEIPKSNTSGSSSSAPKEKTKTLAEKKKELESKRQFSVLRQLMKAIAGTKVKDIKNPNEDPPLCEVLKLAVFMGTDSDVIHKFNGSHYGQEVMHKYAKSLNNKSTEDLTEMLFEAVKPNLIEEVTYNDAITRTPESNIKAGKAIADLLGLDIDAMYKKACEEYPVPKAWKAENENNA